MPKTKTYKPVHYDELAKDMVVYIKRKNGTIDYVDYDLNFHTSQNKLPEKIKRRFQLEKGYADDEDGMSDYMSTLKRHIKELFCQSKLKYGTGLLYTNGFSHNSSVMSIFKQLTPSKLYDWIEQVDLTESEYIEANYNGGLQFCLPQTCITYSYDFSSMYPNCLIDKAFYISSKCGKEITLDKMPTYDELYMGFGYIRCRIICSDPDIKKLIAFSPSHTYTDIVIMFAYELQKQYKIQIELILDDKPNCYKYDQEDLTQTRDIFMVWYAKLIQLKDKHPSNKLLKRCLSSLWGCLVQANKITRTEEQCIDEDLDYDYIGEVDWIVKDVCYNADGSEYYELTNRQKPYLHNLARIKAYLTAFARVKIAKVALKKLDKVLRIHTDSVSFAEPFKNANITGLLFENKTSGLIKWTNANVYEKLIE